jgi:outer membrane receptor protein involved in Fe transport
VGANITWQHQFGAADVMVKLAVYNLFNEERVLEVDESSNPTSVDDTFLTPTTWTAPRYGQLTFQVKF